jgi:ribosome maturation factor RimP
MQNDHDDQSEQGPSVQPTGDDALPEQDAFSEDEDGSQDDGVIGDEAPTGSSPVADRVQRLLEPVLPTVGVELIDVEFTGGSLRVVIDRDGGISTDALAEANRLISPILDQHDPVPGRYTLEVSSPGVERPLRRLGHFRRAVGEMVVVKTAPGVEPRRIRGTLTAVDQDALNIDVVEIDGVDLTVAEQRTVAVVDVAGARTVYDWGPTPKQPVRRGEPKDRPKQRQSQRKAKKSGSGGKKSGPGGKKSGTKKSASQQSNPQSNPQPNQKQNTNKEGRP